jgi:hypothetical protein
MGIVLGKAEWPSTSARTRASYARTLSVQRPGSVAIMIFYKTEAAKSYQGNADLC